MCEWNYLNLPKKIFSFIVKLKESRMIPKTIIKVHLFQINSYQSSDWPVEFFFSRVRSLWSVAGCLCAGITVKFIIGVDAFVNLKSLRFLHDIRCCNFISLHYVIYLY